jgi:AAA ATPase domain
MSAAEVAAVLVASGADASDEVVLVYPTASQALGQAVVLRQDWSGVRIGVHVGAVSVAPLPEWTATTPPAGPLADGPLPADDAVAAVARALSQRAGPGQILVTRLVAGLGGRGFRMVDGAPLEVAGTSYGVQEVVSGPGTGALPVPPALEPGLTPCVGRRPELEGLLAAWRQTAGGEPRGVLIGGDAGIGKTRLAAELAARVHEGGGLVLYGDCDEHAGHEYGPFVEALRDAVASRPAERLEAVAGIGSLVALTSDLRRRLPGVPVPDEPDPAAQRYLTGEALVQFLRSLEARVLLVVDDLQWASTPTLLLIRHLLRTGERLPLFLVLNYRGSEVDRHHPLWEAMAAVRKEGRLDRLELTGLDEGASVEFVAAAAGHDLDQRSTDFACALCDRTGGNPFFMQEILNHLTEAGTIYQVDGRWTADAGVTVHDLSLPDSVRAVIGRRLAHLTDPTRHLLRVGSVAGRLFSLELLEEVVGVEDRPDAVLLAVEEALEAGVLVEPGPGQLTFAHALFRQELAAELDEAARLELQSAIDKARAVLPPVRFPGS